MKHILTDSLTPYVGKVLSLYLELPETPLRTNLYDQKCAAELSGFPAGFSAEVAAAARGATLVPDPLSGLLPTGHRRAAGLPALGQLRGISSNKDEILRRKEVY